VGRRWSAVDAKGHGQPSQYHLPGGHHGFPSTIDGDFDTFAFSFELLEFCRHPGWVAVRACVGFQSNGIPWAHAWRGMVPTFEGLKLTEKNGRVGENISETSPHFAWKTVVSLSRRRHLPVAAGGSGAEPGWLKRNLTSCYREIVCGPERMPHARYDCFIMSPSDWDTHAPGRRGQKEGTAGGVTVITGQRASIRSVAGAKLGTGQAVNGERMALG